VALRRKKTARRRFLGGLTKSQSSFLGYRHVVLPITPFVLFGATQYVHPALLPTANVLADTVTELLK
jgi:hypothetical protein